VLHQIDGRLAQFFGFAANLLGSGFVGHLPMMSQGRGGVCPQAHIPVVLAMIFRLWHDGYMGHKSKSRPKGERTGSNVTAPKVKEMAKATQVSKQKKPR
jgi:hypothetical protein